MAKHGSAFGFLTVEVCGKLCEVLPEMAGRWANSKAVFGRTEEGLRQYLVELAVLGRAVASGMVVNQLGSGAAHAQIWMMYLAGLGSTCKNMLSTAKNGS